MKQGRSVNSALFTPIMFNRIGDNPIKSLCHTDDATLLADSEDGSQWFLQTFNMEKSTSKRKRMVIAGEPRLCQLELNNKIIKQVTEST